MTPDQQIQVLEMYGEIDLIDAPFNEDQFLARFFVRGARRARLYVSFADTEDEAIYGLYDQLNHSLWLKCKSNA
jgi:hypothetical protein